MVNVVSRLIALLLAALVIGAIYIPSVGAKKVVNGTVEVPDTFMVPHKPSVDGGDTGVPYGFIKPKKQVMEIVEYQLVLLNQRNLVMEIAGCQLGS